MNVPPPRGGPRASWERPGVAAARRLFALAIRAFLALVSLYLLFVGVALVFMMFEEINQAIDYGWDGAYGPLNGFFLCAGTFTAALPFSAAPFVWRRRARIASRLAGLPLDSLRARRGDGEPAGARAGCTIGRPLAAICIVALLAGAFALNRRSRTYTRLYMYHYSASRNGHACGETPSPLHAAYHDRMQRKSFAIARFPLLLDTPEPGEPACTRSPVD